MGTWSVVMRAICGCTLLCATRHSDQGVKCKVDWPLAGYNTIKLPFTLLYIRAGDENLTRINPKWFKISLDSQFNIDTFFWYWRSMLLLRYAFDWLGGVHIAVRSTTQKLRFASYSKLGHGENFYSVYCINVCPCSSFYFIIKKYLKKNFKFI